MDRGELRLDRAPCFPGPPAGQACRSLCQTLLAPGGRTLLASGSRRAPCPWLFREGAGCVRQPEVAGVATQVTAAPAPPPPALWCRHSQALLSHGAQRCSLHMRLLHPHLWAPGAQAGAWSPRELCTAPRGHELQAGGRGAFTCFRGYKVTASSCPCGRSQDPLRCQTRRCSAPLDKWRSTGWAGGALQL